MSLERPAKNTPQSAAQMREALDRLAPDLDNQQKAFILAHTALETRNFQSLKQFNVGNISTRDDKGLPFWRPNWYAEPGPDASERTKRLHQLMLEHKAPSAFRAYDTLDQGFGDYLRQMRGRFSPMLRARSASEFVKEWRNTGYTPDLDVDATLPNFTSLARKFGAVDTPLLDAGGSAVLLGFFFAGGLLWAMKKRG